MKKNIKQLIENNGEYYELGKALRAFGWIRDLKDKSDLANKFSNIDSRFLFVNLGFNIRPTDLQGAFGIHQIKKLECLKENISQIVFLSLLITKCGCDFNMLKDKCPKTFFKLLIFLFFKIRYFEKIL